MLNGNGISCYFDNDILMKMVISAWIFTKLNCLIYFTGLKYKNLIFKFSIIEINFFINGNVTDKSNGNYSYFGNGSWVERVF